MATYINYEVFSPAMKVKLDPAYRRYVKRSDIIALLDFGKIIAKLIMKQFYHLLPKLDHMVLIRGQCEHSSKKAKNN